MWGTVPTVVEMQSEGGAAGALHGSLQAGALATTFTASQGLLLMLPNMYKIAGELTPAVFHVAARSLAAQGLSIFGDHSDVMAARGTGFALLASASVQEAHDLAVVAQAATLRSRVPFIHFFDGFRTSHELNTIEPLSDDDLRALVSEELVHAHRGRALSPDRPFIRGTAQNPDTYFQSRETVNPYYARTAEIVQGAMDELAERVGRSHGLVSYHGHPEAERVLVLIGSGAVTARGTVERLVSEGERVGASQIRLVARSRRQAVLAALAAPPSAGSRCSTARRSPVARASRSSSTWSRRSARRTPSGTRELPLVVGGRYGLSSKEFTPAMVAGVLDELARDRPRRRFTVGINDDVGGTSIADGPPLDIEPPGTVRAVFFGLGSDGTVGANKNTIKILGDAGLCAQGYFVYDSKKSGSQTVSHLRFGEADRGAVSRGRGELRRLPPVRSPRARSTCWAGPPTARRCSSTARTLRTRSGTRCRSRCRSRSSRRASPSLRSTLLVAREAGLPGRTNTVLQTCFFALSGVLPRDEAIDAHQGGDRAHLRPPRRRRRRAEQRGRRQRARGASRREMPGRATSEHDLPLAGARLGTRVRPLGDRDDAGRPRRRAARERPAGRRHLPERHRRLREAQHLRPRGRVGSRHLHPVREL